MKKPLLICGSGASEAIPALLDFLEGTPAV